MKKSSPPQVPCRRLAGFNLTSWESGVAALASAQPIPLGQHWNAEHEKAFLPATVRTGWTESDLIVFAELDDVDIFNPVTQFNAMSFQHGDVFEMFLRPAEQAAYCEFHVSPMNQKLQLRFPSTEEFRTPRPDPGIPRGWMLSDRQIFSQVKVDQARNRWSVLAAVPFAMVADSGQAGMGSQWLFSFSRYDYTRGREKPVLSSTSPHVEVNFHRQQEWGTLRFE